MPILGFNWSQHGLESLGYKKFLWPSTHSVSQLWGWYIVFYFAGRYQDGIILSQLFLVKFIKTWMRICSLLVSLLMLQCISDKCETHRTTPLPQVPARADKGPQVPATPPKRPQAFCMCMLVPVDICPYVLAIDKYSYGFWYVDNLGDNLTQFLKCSKKTFIQHNVKANKTSDAFVISVVHRITRLFTAGLTPNVTMHIRQMWNT